MTRVEKGWGYELWIVNKKEYCGKLLFFNKDKKCSYHYHKIKDETFYLQSGSMKVLWADDDRSLDLANVTWLEPGQSFYIPPYRRHMMVAHKDCELFEFSTQHFEEDSYRIVKGD
jgi:oxalate decarboxylase/phosphoglucose isomerase-like protein (cupin superfamily)